MTTLHECTGVWIIVSVSLRPETHERQTSRHRVLSVPRGTVVMTLRNRAIKRVSPIALGNKRAALMCPAATRREHSAKDELWCGHLTALQLFQSKTPWVAQCHRGMSQKRILIKRKIKTCDIILQFMILIKTHKALTVWHNGNQGAQDYCPLIKFLEKGSSSCGV